MSDRWDWFQKHTGRQTFPRRAPLSAVMATYNDWLLNGIPAAAMVARFQQDRQTPLAVEWELFPEEGAFSPAGPVAPEAAATCWGLSATVDNSVVAAIWVKWSTAGVTRWKLADLASRGTLVVPACDWLEVYAITCDDPETGPILPITLDVGVVVRPAEQHERSQARCSMAPFVSVTQPASYIVLLFLGPSARLRTLEIGMYSATAASVLHARFLRADSTPLTGIAWTPVASGGGLGVLPAANILQPFSAPVGTVYMQFASTAGTANVAISAEVE